MTTLVVREFTDPACPWAFSAEPLRWRLLWLFGDALVWERRMVVLSGKPEDFLARGFTGERQEQAFRRLQRRFGMPIEPSRPA